MEEPFACSGIMDSSLSGQNMSVFFVSISHLIHRASLAATQAAGSGILCEVSLICFS